MVSNYHIAENFRWAKNFTKPSYLCIAEIFGGINFRQYYSHAQSHIHCLHLQCGFMAYHYTILLHNMVLKYKVLQPQNDIGSRKRCFTTTV